VDWCCSFLKVAVSTVPLTVVQFEGVTECIERVFMWLLVIYIYIYIYIDWGHAVAQLLEALRYKPERRGFDSRWCHWN
jgi:hypothetical protein